jgi:hypothetical protein
MSDHALLSPSGADGWIACPPKLAMELGQAKKSSEFADEGTAAHTLASWCLTENRDALAYKGRRIAVGHRTFEVDAEMVENVQTYVDAIHDRIRMFELQGAIAVNLLVEVRVNFSRFVDHPDQFGTSDAVLLIDWPDGRGQVDVNDLKYGRGVRVYAERNAQMMLYGLGAFDRFSTVGEFHTVSMAIHQPRLGHMDEWQIDTPELLEWVESTLRPAAEQAVYLYQRRVMGDGVRLEDLNPGDKQCRFCKAKAICPAAEAKVLSTVADDFVDVTQEVAPQLLPAQTRIENAADLHIGNLMRSLDFIESWCKAVRSQAESRLLAGADVPGYKLVEGRKGARAWSDAQEAEKAMKALRLKRDEMYDFKIISPTSADKLLSKTAPKRWEKLKALITQPKGGLSVAPTSDKRPAVTVTPTADDFDDVTTQGELA